MNGLPSCQVTFGRSLNVTVLPSGETVHDCASDGSGFMLMSYSSSPSKILVPTSVTVDAEVRALVSVVGSGTVMITSVPPCVAACAAGPHSAPQSAAIPNAALIHARRFHP